MVSTRPLPGADELARSEGARAVPVLLQALTHTACTYTVKYGLYRSEVYYLVIFGHHIAIQAADAQTILNASSARMLRASYGVM